MTVVATSASRPVPGSEPPDARFLDLTAPDALLRMHHAIRTARERHEWHRLNYPRHKGECALPQPTDKALARAVLEILQEPRELVK